MKWSDDRSSGTKPRASPATAQSRPQPAQPLPAHSAVHAEFLLNQTRQNVNHLAATNALDPLLCRQLQTLLASAKIRAPPPPSRPSASEGVVKRGSKQELGAKNRWTREVLGDTSLLPSIVDTALSASLGPMLSSNQRGAIVQIVEHSQNRIAEAVTDPERQAALQNWTASSAKATQAGFKGGLKSAGENFDKWSQQRLENTSSNQAARLAERQLEEELKRERELFRQRDSLPSSSSALPPAPPAKEVDGASNTVLLPNNPAAASVACFPSQHVADANSTGIMTSAGASTTTFSPWPGLILTYTVVATHVDADVPADQELTDGRTLPPPHASSDLPPTPSIHSSIAPPPPRRDLPPPTSGVAVPSPSHPTSLAPNQPASSNVKAPTMRAVSTHPVTATTPTMPNGEDPPPSYPGLASGAAAPAPASRMMPAPRSHALPPTMPASLRPAHPPNM